MADYLRLDTWPRRDAFEFFRRFDKPFFNVCVRLDVARLMADLRDIAFSAGSACASGSGRPSHVLSALGLTDKQARSSIRLGFGRYTTQEELIAAVRRIDEAARQQSRFAA